MHVRHRREERMNIFEISMRKKRVGIIIKLNVDVALYTTSVCIVSEIDCKTERKKA